MGWAHIYVYYNYSNKHSVFIEIYMMSRNTENYSSYILAWLWYCVSVILTYVHDNVSPVIILVWIWEVTSELEIPWYNKFQKMKECVGISKLKNHINNIRTVTDWNSTKTRLIMRWYLSNKCQPYTSMICVQRKPLKWAV